MRPDDASFEFFPLQNPDMAEFHLSGRSDSIKHGSLPGLALHNRQRLQHVLNQRHPCVGGDLLPHPQSRKGPKRAIGEENQRQEAQGREQRRGCPEAMREEAQQNGGMKRGRDALQDEPHEVLRHLGNFMDQGLDVLRFVPGLGCQLLCLVVHGHCQCAHQLHAVTPIPELQHRVGSEAEQWCNEASPKAEEASVERVGFEALVVRAAQPLQIAEHQLYQQHGEHRVDDKAAEDKARDQADGPPADEARKHPSQGSAFRTMAPHLGHPTSLESLVGLLGAVVASEPSIWILQLRHHPRAVATLGGDGGRRPCNKMLRRSIHLGIRSCRQVCSSHLVRSRTTSAPQEHGQLACHKATDADGPAADDQLPGAQVQGPLGPPAPASRCVPLR
mmetsp:Transcript_100398/g.321959  ORF Transcript_100398/g.321959 Transcript_100398/m.321959 type:complete len:389 (+) Transcript_100398:141-1307(+)